MTPENRDSAGQDFTNGFDYRRANPVSVSGEKLIPMAGKDISQTITNFSAISQHTLKDYYTSGKKNADH